MNKHSRRRAVLAFCGFIALPAAHATVVDFNDFSSTAGLTLIGNTAAATTVADGNVLRLTSAGGNQAGAAYSSTPITLGDNDTFSTTFKFRFTQPGGWDPADGITFVLAAAPTGLGGIGVGMGYVGVPKSVAIEFDTYNNTGYGLGDDDGASSNHVSIDTNGVLANAHLTNVYGNGSCGFTDGYPPQNSHNVFGCMSNGDVWTVQLGYDGHDLSLRIQDGNGPADTIYSSLPLDVASFLGTDQAYVGFTSGTGAGWENHDILSWQFADTTQFTPTVPEPSSSILLAVGLAGAAATRLRREKMRS